MVWASFSDTSMPTEGVDLLRSCLSPGRTELIIRPW